MVGCTQLTNAAGVERCLPIFFTSKSRNVCKKYRGGPGWHAAVMKLTQNRRFVCKKLHVKCATYPHCRPIARRGARLCRHHRWPAAVRQTRLDPTRTSTLPAPQSGESFSESYEFILDGVRGGDSHQGWVRKFDDTRNSTKSPSTQRPPTPILSAQFPPGGRYETIYFAQLKSTS